MPVLANVRVNTARPIRNSQGSTSSAKPYQNSISGHMDLTHQATYQPLPAGGFRVTYTLEVDLGADIVAGDVITAIYRMDGVTNWGPLAPQLRPNDLWVVVFYTDDLPGPLAERCCYVERRVTGGPA